MLCADKVHHALFMRHGVIDSWMLKRAKLSVMKHKESMQKAYREKDAEYYTLYEDIAAELPQYREQLRGKRIICPCDWDESYNEELVYKEEGVTASDLFSNGSIKHLDLAASKDKFDAFDSSII